MHGASVRIASVPELPQVVEILRHARVDSPLGPQLCSPDSATLDAQLATWCSLPGAVLFVAEVSEKIVGTALAQRVEANLFSDVTFMQLEALYVDAPYRRHGVGRALMHAVGQLAAEVAASHVVTMPLAGSRSEQRFLSGLGFAPVATRRIAETAALLRRVDVLAMPRRSRGIEQVIARRRRSRGLSATPPSGIAVKEEPGRVSP